MKRISILILLVFFSCSSPVLAAKHHKPRLTKREAHAATEKRLQMLKAEWPEIIVNYMARGCKYHLKEDMACSYELTNDPEGAAQPIICLGLALLHLNHGNTRTVNIDVTLGTCESQEAWKSTW